MLREIKEIMISHVKFTIISRTYLYKSPRIAGNKIEARKLNKYDEL